MSRKVDLLQRRRFRSSDLLIHADVFLYFVCSTVRKIGVCMKRNIFFIFTTLYLVIIIWLLFFFPYTSVNRLDHSVERHINPVPLETTSQYFYNAWKYANWAQFQQLLSNVGGNILLFVPLGVILHQLKRIPMKWWVALLLGALISSTVETIQITTGVGSFDVDDILLNTLGTLLGYWLCIYVPVLRFPNA